MILYEWVHLGLGLGMEKEGSRAWCLWKDKGDSELLSVQLGFSTKALPA